jgi:hypothetical protein
MWYEAERPMSDALQRVDVGILTFQEEDFAAVEERVVDGRRMYDISRGPLEGGESYSVAVFCCLEEMGSGNAAKAARDVHP